MLCYAMLYAITIWFVVHMATISFFQKLLLVKGKRAIMQQSKSCDWSKCLPVVGVFSLDVQEQVLKN